MFIHTKHKNKNVDQLIIEKNLLNLFFELRFMENTFLFIHFNLIFCSFCHLISNLK